MPAHLAAKNYYIHKIVNSHLITGRICGILVKIGNANYYILAARDIVLPLKPFEAA
jgi:hypothetical protein